MNERHLIDATAEARDQAAKPFSGLAVRLPIPRAFHAGPRLALEQLDLAARIEFFAVAFDQLRLVVKRVALARRARHEELNHPLGLGAVMEAAVQLLPRQRRRRVGQGALITEQIRERNPAEAAAETPEKFPPINVARVFRAEAERALARGTGVEDRVHRSFVLRLNR